MTSLAAPPDAGAPEAAVEWTFNPWQERRAAAVTALAAAIGLTLVAGWAPIAPLTRAVLAGVALVSLGPGFAAVRCRVDQAGLARRVAFLWWDRRGWGAIRFARLLSRGCLALSRAPESPLARFGALFLPLPSRARGAQELRARLERRLAEHGF